MRYPILALATSIALGLSLPASAAQSFAYVATCGQSTSCAVPQLLVYDANTAHLVTAIDLPAGTPRAVAMAPDGSRLYVSIDAAAGPRLAVVDTTAHVLAGSYVAPGAGGVAVARDGARVFVLSTVSDSSTVYAFDTSTHVFGPFVVAGPAVLHIAANPARDRLYLTGRDTSGSGIRAYHSMTGAVLARYPGPCLSHPVFCPGPAALAVSPDGTRVYYGEFFPKPVLATTLRTLDPESLQATRNFSCSVRTLAEAETRQRLYMSNFNVVMWSPIAATTMCGQEGGTITLPSWVNGLALSRDETRAWASMMPDNEPTAMSGLAIIDTANDAVLPTISLPTPPTPIVATPKHATVACRYEVDKAHSPWAIAGGTTSLTLTTPCAWSASSDAPWARIDVSTGLGTTTFTLTVDANPLAENRSATLVIAGQPVTVTQAGSASVAPFGVIDTPTDSLTNVAGELAVLGWALDDVGTTRVQIYRDPVSGETPGQLIYIGDGTFVDGARPDVQAVFPSYPLASRAGWGYMLLTNTLPGSGNGTYRLIVIATDIEGHQTVLGTRTITAANSASATPFGTIDTPGQGEAVSGTIINFGWALTPQPKVIPFDGSTIDVIIDGVVVGHPTYGFARSDVDTLFPGYANTGRAVGYFVIDTTTLTNGVHSIAWVVRDNQGAAAGIGARFFTVINP